MKEKRDGKIQNILSGIGITVLLLLWFGWQMRNDYSWSEQVIQEKQKDGWIVGTTQDNYVDIVHPWTIVKQPVVRVAFVNPDKFARLENEMVFTNVLWVDYADMSRTEEEIFQNIYDCKNNRSAFVNDDISPNNINFSTIKWRDFASAYETDIARVICK